MCVLRSLFTEREHVVYFEVEIWGEWNRFGACLFDEYLNKLKIYSEQFPYNRLRAKSNRKGVLKIISNS